MCKMSLSGTAGNMTETGKCWQAKNKLEASVKAQKKAELFNDMSSLLFVYLPVQ